MRLALALLVSAVVAQQPRWQIERSRLATILFGITYVDEFNGFVQGAQDGLGPLILRSTNGGNSYQSVAHSGGTLMFMSGAAHSPSSAAAAGVGILTSGVQYTTDGQSFTDASIPVGFPPVGSSQSGGAVKNRRQFRDGAFGFVGSFSEVRGVSFTPDGGSTWNMIPIPETPAPARYGSYPSMTTWYVSGGRWPPRADKKEDASRFELSEHLAALFPNSTAASFEVSPEPTNEKTGYIAYIVKTTNGGQSWQQVFYNEDDAYYFNGIDCADENTCLAVAEGLNGARLMGTTDGGNTWTQRLFLPGRAASLFDVKFVNSREAWACGGMFDLSFTGRFYHTLDSGNTWTEHQIPGVLGTTLTFTPVGESYHGHATAITLDGQSSTLVYK